MDLKKIKSEITKLHYEAYSKSRLMPALSVMSFFYEIITSVRNFLYDKNILKSEKVNAYVISVGNLTTGGVGKTPLVAEIARYFIMRDKRVAIISRGYGGKISNKKVNIVSNGDKIFYTAEQAGDEPYWLAENVNNAVVLTCSNRVKAAKFAIKNMGTDVIILDDAFQHRRIHRDLNLVLIDSEKLLGNQKHLPAGPLRENIRGLQRADKLVIVNKTLKRIDIKILNNIFDCYDEQNTFVCRLVPGFTYDIKTSELLTSNSDVTAVCAIGQPEQFYNFVSQKYNIKSVLTFDDHHVYTEQDLANIEGNIVTTEKDAVKLKNFKRNNIYALKLKAEIDVERLLNGQNR